MSDIEAIKARHEAANELNAEMTVMNWRIKHGAAAHADRATLLSLLTAAEARAEAAEARVGEATAYARDLAVAIVRKHYPENTVWEPLPDLMGILTQIDNATTGLARTLKGTPDGR